MALRIHFISGLPRSGSTLLAAILRQNPAFHAAMSGALAELFVSVLRTMSVSENALFISDAQRERVLHAIAESFYADLSDRKLIFDTNRSWCGMLPALAQIFPDSRVVCCVRNPAWILDSVEQLVQRNALLASRMFNAEIGNVYGRVEVMMKNGLVGPALSNLRQAWFGKHADRLVAIRYDSLVAHPAEIINKLYDVLGEDRFTHDFDHVEYDEPEFDDRIGMPGLHRVAARVEPRKRETILPPDLFSQHDRDFWDMPGQNPRRVIVL
jgi:sulfotransferase